MTGLSQSVLSVEGRKAYITGEGRARWQEALLVCTGLEERRLNWCTHATVGGGLFGEDRSECVVAPLVLWLE